MKNILSLFIGRMKWISLGVVGSVILLSIIFAYSASNTISPTYAMDEIIDVTPGIPVPPECAGMTFTNILYGVNGTNQPDLIFAGSSAAVINGNGGNDCIVGSDYGDNLSGGAGNDVILGRGGSDVLSGGNGSDTLYGGDGDDILAGENHQDYLYGEEGADILDGGNHRDTCDMGPGGYLEVSCEL